MSDPSDEELIEACLAGPTGSPAVAGAFRLLHQRHAAATQRFLRALCPSEAAAQDAFQETLLRALAALARFERGQSFRAWLLGVARHAALDLLRRERTRATEPLPEAPVPAPSGPCQLEQRELAALVHHALDALPDDLRQACELRHLESGSGRAPGCPR